jgi:hypothetical protein
MFLLFILVSCGKNNGTNGENEYFLFDSSKLGIEVADHDLGIKFFHLKIGICDQHPFPKRSNHEAHQKINPKILSTNQSTFSSVIRPADY